MAATVALRRVDAAVNLRWVSGRRVDRNGNSASRSRRCDGVVRGSGAGAVMVIIGLLTDSTPPVLPDIAAEKPFLYTKCEW